MSLDEIKINGETYYWALGGLDLQVKELSIGSGITIAKEKRTSFKAAGKAVVTIDGLVDIQDDYHNSEVNLTISSLDDIYEFSEQLINESKNGATSIAALYYNKEKELIIDGITITSVTNESAESSYFGLDIYVTNDVLNYIISSLLANNVTTISVECGFNNLLTNDFSPAPWEAKILPPKEAGNFYNCIGVVDNISWGNGKHLFDYVSPGLNGKIISQKNHSVTPVEISQTELKTKSKSSSTLHFVKIERYLICIIILLLINLFF